MKIHFVGLRSAQIRQRYFEFIDRHHRHERWFKRSIILATGLVIAVIVNAVPWGIYLWYEIGSSAQKLGDGGGGSAQNPGRGR